MESTLRSRWVATGEFKRSVESEEDVRIRREMDKVALGEPQSTSVNVTLHHVKGEGVGIPAASRNKKVAKRNHRSNLLVPGGGVEPPRAEARRILSTQRGSAPFGKFSTLSHFSTAYKRDELNRSDPICTVLTIELLQFYYSSVGKPRGM
jgi:hypothetical protein